MRLCHRLKGFCVRHEWAGGTAALLGVSLFIGTIWFGIEHHLAVRGWVAHNPLPHAVLFGAATLIDVLAVFGLLCLGFSECSQADRDCRHAYRGRRSVLFPETTRWIEALGRNPRRNPQPS